MPDFELTNHGSIATLKPLTDEARDWIADHIPDDAQFWNDAVAIEPRYVDQILHGIYNDGLHVQ